MHSTGNKSGTRMRKKEVLCRRRDIGFGIEKGICVFF